MKKLIDNLDHHSLLFIGDREDIINRVIKEISSFGVSTISNPDLFINKFENISIFDVRDVLEKAFYKSFNNKGKRFFVLSFSNMAVDAQNAFLKGLEEPAEDVIFILIAPENFFIETFLSRMKVVSLKTTAKSLNFLDKNISDKLDFVSKLCKDVSDDKKSKDQILEFINQVEKEILEKGEITEQKDRLKSCLKAKEAVLKRGALTKMILENLVLQIS